jgi:hypothetical protein
MSFFMKTAGAPLCLLALGVVVALVVNPESPIAAALFAVAFFWLLLTGKMRRTYWNARIRARGSYDERRARARASR